MPDPETTTLGMDCSLNTRFAVKGSHSGDSETIRRALFMSRKDGPLNEGNCGVKGSKGGRSRSQTRRTPNTKAIILFLFLEGWRGVGERFRRSVPTTILSGQVGQALCGAHHTGDLG